MQKPFQDSQLTAVLGPTNTGKTHYAIERMMGHESGIIGLPLRLLAREVYEKVKAQKGAGQVALITGEEKILPPRAKYFVCTVESMPQDRSVSFLAIDEIQLAADPDRGHVFTERLLHARGRHETVFLGAETMRGKLRSLFDDITFTTRPRFSHLSFMGSKKVSRLPRRSAIVGFSSDQVYAIAELIRRQRGGAAVVMGGLSPKTRNAQVELYQSGEVDFLVATDAIGMGLNMDVDHVAFSDIRKFDGRGYRDLNANELAQIAGRAGRYLNDGTFGTTTDCPTLSQDLIEQIEEHDFEPVRALQWRNAKLDYSSLQNLVRSLELKSPRKGLMRTRDADDVLALRALMARPEITDFVLGPAGVKQLWDVCQIPDFRKVMADEHANLLGNLFEHLQNDEGHLNEDWLAAHVKRCDHTEGDLDTLSNRIAHTRTWTYVSNRTGWLRDHSHWQERTRAVEDRLSDALHERLTQRFVDRRTNYLIRRLKSEEALMAAISSDGEVTVEGEFVGRMNGFRFFADNRVQSGSALEAKALRAAATKAIEPEIDNRVQLFASAADTSIELRPDGTLWWLGGQVARLIKGETALRPQADLIADTLMSSTQRESVQIRLDAWLNTHLSSQLEPLIKIETAVNAKGADTILSGLARGVGYQLQEELGFLNRANVVDDIKALDQPARSQLRKLGVRFGEFSIYMPALLKPAPAKILVVLRAIADERQEDGRFHEPMPAGLTSLEGEKSVPNATYNAAGYRRCGKRIVRLDILERLAGLIRDQRNAQMDNRKASEKKVSAPFYTFPAFQTKKKVLAPRGAFAITPDMMSLLGCSGEDFEEVLKALSYRPMTIKSGGEAHLFWRYHARDDRSPRQSDARRTGTPKGKRPQQREGGRAGPKAKPGKRPQGQPNKAKPSRPQKKQETKVDADSPFAVLQALKNKK